MYEINVMIYSKISIKYAPIIKSMEEIIGKWLRL